MSTQDPSLRRRGKVKLAISLMVAAAIVVSAILYFVATGIRDIDGLLPSVHLGRETRNAANVTVDVAAASPGFGLSHYTALLFVGGVQRAVLAPPEDNASDWIFSFHERDADGHLNAGDWFRVEVVAPGEYELSLAYDDHVVARASWVI